MLLLGTRNATLQDVAIGGIINLGSVYRRFCKKNNCGIPTFANTTQDITLQQAGIYHVTATFVGSADAAGVVTVQLLENGVPVVGVFSSQTITTATTELRTFVIDYYVLVDDNSILGRNSVSPVTISFANTGAVAANFTSVVVNVTKEV